MAMLDAAMDRIESDGLRGLIVHNDAQHFSCGVNLQAVREFFRNEDMDAATNDILRNRPTSSRLPP